MDAFLSQALTSKIPSLTTTAARMNLPEGVHATTMKHRMLRMAAELTVPVIIRRIAGGLLFWRSTDEEAS
jgi:hypothetical protein